MALTHGVTFTEGAAASLIDLAGTNTVTLDSEIRKLALAHRGDDPVNQNEVIALVRARQRSNRGNFSMRLA